MTMGTYPFIMVSAIPTMFLYYGAALFLGELLKKNGVFYPVAIALVFLLSLGFAASYALNVPINKQINDFKHLDLVLEKEFSVPETIAVYSQSYLRARNDCNNLCQLLLAKSNVKKVIIINNSSVLNSFQENVLVAYRVKADDTCTVRKPKEWKISEECLIRENASVTQADAVFIHEELKNKVDYQNYMSLSRRVVRANYIELLENRNGEFKKIYRYTEILAQPFVYPLSFGLTFRGDFKLGFLHYTTTVNNPGSSYSGPILEFRPQMNMLFGESVISSYSN